jgi:DNA modification methylase
MTTKRFIKDRITELIRVRAGDLSPHPSNWRVHPANQRSAVSAMLTDVGYADALIAYRQDGELVLIDGHLRAGLDPDQEVPVLVLDVDAEEAKRVLATLDPLAGLALADTEALALLREELAIDDEAIQAMFDQILGSPAQLVGDDFVPEPPSVPESSPGDIWILGRHRLMCGDATNAQDVARLLDGARPSLMVTDQPFGSNYDPTWRAKEAVAGKLAYGARRLGRVENDERSDWQQAWELSPSYIAYVWHGSLHTATVQRSLEAAGYEIRSQLIWAKPHFPISRGHYHWRHEPCLYGVRRGAKASWRGGRKQSTVWDDISLDPNVQGGHSTQKPLEAMARPIRNHAGDVYDPFVGSGTTIVAAEHLDRTCFAMEISPAYTDAARWRWEHVTGKAAVKA